MAISEINVGAIPNDGTGDSIRDAFIKANDNFTFLDEARQNLVTGNLTASGNISLTAVQPSYLSGTFFLNGVQIATVGTLFSGGAVANPTTFQSTTPSTSNITGAVVIAGGLGVGGSAYTSELFARSFTSETSIAGATLTIGGLTQLQAGVETGNVTTTGFNTTSGNITGANVAGFKGSYTQLTGTLLTNAQPHVTSVGSLTTLSVVGNITASNLTLTWGNLTAANASLSGKLTTANLLVTANTTIQANLTAGNVISGIGTFGNLTVTTIPTPKSVTTKEYVTATVVGFAIGLGS
jgi:hypothetical protein